MKKRSKEILFKFIFIISGYLTVTATILSFTVEIDTAPIELYKKRKFKKRTVITNAIYRGDSLGVGVGLNNHPQEEIIKWKFEARRIADKTYEIHFTPKVRSPWHIYSMYDVVNIGFPTAINFNKNPLVILQGKVKEIGVQQDFVQIVNLKSNVRTIISGEVEFMVCNDMQCLPPQTVNFSILLQPRASNFP